MNILINMAVSPDFGRVIAPKDNEKNHTGRRRMIIYVLQCNLELEMCLVLANQYDSNARFNIGLMYELGINVDQNYFQAYEWYKKSSALGNEDARSNMEYLIKKGLVY